MSLSRSVAAELRKTATLPATFVALVVAILGPVAIATLNALSVRNAIASGRPDAMAYTSPAEAAFSAVPLGTVGAVVLGVVAISSEYTANSDDAGDGRQFTTTLTATPRRHAVLAAKTLTLALLVLGATAAAIPASLAVSHLIIEDATPASTLTGHLVGRALGAGLYWLLTALMALAITVLTRNGIVPLIVLIANSSLVSFSLLLSQLTPLARYLPDLAGTRLFAHESLVAVDDTLDPRLGGLVMAAWAAGLLVIAVVVFTRRDA